MKYDVTESLVALIGKWRFLTVYITGHALLRERGKGQYGNEVISMLLPFSNNFSRYNYHV